MSATHQIIRGKVVMFELFDLLLFRLSSVIAQKVCVVFMAVDAQSNADWGISSISVALEKSGLSTHTALAFVRAPMSTR
jgi:hypothetical protein